MSNEKWLNRKVSVGQSSSFRGSNSSKSNNNSPSFRLCSSTGGCDTITFPCSLIRTGPTVFKVCSLSKGLIALKSIKSRRTSFTFTIEDS